MSVTPIMDSTVPCDGQESTIYKRNQRVDATVFVKYNSTDCRFTARLYTNGPAGARILEAELVVPAGRGYRAVGGSFDDFVVICEPPVAAPQVPPQVQAPSRRQQRVVPVARRPAAREDCKFEWYVVF